MRVASQNHVVFVYYEIGNEQMDGGFDGVKRDSIRNNAAIQSSVNSDQNLATSAERNPTGR